MPEGDPGLLLFGYSNVMGVCGSEGPGLTASDFGLTTLPFAGSPIVAALVFKASPAASELFRRLVKGSILSSAGAFSFRMLAGILSEFGTEVVFAVFGPELEGVGAGSVPLKTV